MTRKPKETTSEPTGKAIRLPSEKAFKSHHSEATNLKTEISELTGQLGSLTKEAVDKKHLDGGAYRVAAGLANKSSEKLASWLANFDRYRELLKLDELANLQGRLFPAGEKDANGVDRDVDEDGETDPRPTHLRQKGASAASVVQDLAEGAGAKIKPGDLPH